MQVETDASIQQDKPLTADVERASKLLEKELGPSAATTRALWRLLRDERGRDVVDLTVSDWTGSVGYRFAPAELADAAHMKLRLHRLWGDLLQVQSHHQLDSEIWAIHQQAGS